MTNGYDHPGTCNVVVTARRKAPVRNEFALLNEMPADLLIQVTYSLPAKSVLALESSSSRLRSALRANEPLVWFGQLTRSVSGNLHGVRATEPMDFRAMCRSLQGMLEVRGWASSADCDRGDMNAWLAAQEANQRTSERELVTPPLTHCPVAFWRTAGGGALRSVCACSRRSYLGQPEASAADAAVAGAAEVGAAALGPRAEGGPIAMAPPCCPAGARVAAARKFSSATLATARTTMSGGRHAACDAPRPSILTLVRAASALPARASKSQPHLAEGTPLPSG